MELARKRKGFLYGGKIDIEHGPAVVPDGMVEPGSPMRRHLKSSVLRKAGDLGTANGGDKNARIG